ncbi:hypothetical protein [Mesorhizobium sp. CN2-181]|uniref:hypothetical protein n=1 Tax=Mesorhizobium yinganensis TaxID=3157707 RepID=UPI0032B79F0D
MSRRKTTTLERRRELDRARQRRKRDRDRAGKLDTQLGEIGDELAERGDIGAWDADDATAVIKALRAALKQSA